MNEKWTKSNLTPKTDKSQAIEEGFSSAVSNRVAPVFPGTPVAPPIRRPLKDILSAGASIEIELNQTLFIEQAGGLTKFVTTDEGIVTLENLDTETLQVTATGVGSTFVHVWNAEGRNTFSIRVIQPKLVASRFQTRQQEALEKNRPFRFSYDNGRSASYSGEKFRTKVRNSTDFTQNFKLEGDTPYGTLGGRMQTQQSGGKMLLTDANVTLKDGKVGPLRNFNTTVGDTPVGGDMMILPGSRIRGVELEHWDDAKRVQWDAFHGRQNSSVVGILTPSIQTKRTRKAYISGGTMDFKLNDEAKLKAGYYSASGRARADELNRRGVGLKTEVKLGDHTTMNNESDFDNEEFANQHSLTAKFEKLQVRSEFRDVSRKFVTMVGAPARQGEVGNRIDITATPSDLWSASGSLDIFHDRLVPNPDDPNSVNIHSDALLNVYPCEDVNLSFNFQDLDDTGRIGPSRQRTQGVQYNEQFEIWGHRATLFSRYQHRTNHLLTNPLDDYRQDQVVLGLYTQIFWEINFSVSQEWNALEEVEISRFTHPSALTYNWDYSHQIGDTPFFMETSLRIRDEEETESTNSFMSGEDSTEIRGGLYYREYEDLEIFLTGSFTQYVPESLNVPDQRVEAEFFTGMRYLFDTGFRWGAVASFEGMVFKDENGDGVRQPDEPGLPGMTVHASDGKQAVTDEQGFYRIKSVSGRSVILTLDTEKIPRGYAPSSSLSRPMEIRQNTVQKVDFSLTPRSEITGVIFNDLNRNGKYEVSDIGVAKVKILLENKAVARSNDHGGYTFSNVMAGPHTATLDVASLPEGYLPLNAPKVSLTLYEGIRYELNIPLIAKRALTGRVFFDGNGNNMMDPKEKPLSDIPVLFAGHEVVSDKEGWYLFDGLGQGSYQLEIDRSKLPAGFLPPSAVKIDMPAEPLTMSDINIPVKRNPEKILLDR